MQTTMTDEELAEEIIRITDDLDSILFSLKIVKMCLGRRMRDSA